VPSGEYEISKPIMISHDHSGLVGPGRIVQTNPAAQIVVASHATGVQLRDFILMRTPGTDGKISGLVVNSCPNVVIENVQVLDNRAPCSAMNIDKCVNGRIANNLVRNYTSISVDDRTGDPDLGYAFRCIDGTGIQLTDCRGMLVQGNRVEEFNNMPTPALKEKFGLGKFTTKNATKGAHVSQESWDSETFPTWHQGSGIYVGGDPTISDRIQVLGNYVENAAQGIDIHSDHVIVGQNFVNNSSLGVKAMHGSRNILIIGNQFDKCSIHAILLQPGVRSHAAGEPVDRREDPASSPANVDGASIIANNIISDFGYGGENWIYGNGRDCICLEPGQTPQNPPLTDVIVTGNIVYDPGRDKILVNGQPAVVSPRYRYALLIAGAVNVKVSNNILNPGSAGISNIPIPSDSLVNPMPAHGASINK
jgi:parallel beta helix pectate lyase-like protein